MAGTTLKMVLLGEDRGASKSLDHVGSSASMAEAKVSRFGSAARSSASRLSGFGKGVAHIATGFVAFEAASKGAEFLKSAGEQAIDDEKSTALLAKQLENSTGATKAQTKATEDWITAQGKAYGVTDDDLRPALAKLATATGSVTKARRLASLGEDIAAGTGKSLTTVTAALAKAQLGSLGGLSKLGVATKDAKGKTLSLAAVTKDLSKTFKGDATTAANTAAGQWARLNVTYTETKEAIGYKLLPVVTKLAQFMLNTAVPAIGKMAAALGHALAPVIAKIKQGFQALQPVFDKVIGFIKKNPGTVKVFGATLAGLGLVMGTVAIAAGILATAFGSTALSIAAVVLPIAAVAAGLYYAYTHSEKFRHATQAVWAYIKTSVIPTAQKFASFVKTKVIPALVQFGEKVGAFLKPLLVSLANTFTTKIIPATQKAAAKFKEWWPTIQKVGEVVGKAYLKFLQLEGAIAKRVLPVIGKLVTFFVTKVIPAYVDFYIGVGKVIGKLVDFGGAVVHAGTKVAAFAATVARKIGSIIGFFVSLPGRILSALGNLGSTLFNAGTDLINGFVNGIKSKFDDVKNSLGDLTNKLTSWKGPPAKDKTLLTPAGQMLMDGLIKGIESRQFAIKDVLGKVTDYVKAQGDKLKTLLSDRASFADGFKSFSTSVFDNDFTDQETGASTASVANILAFQDQQRAAAATLRANVARLTHMGLSSSLLKQLQASGPQGIAQINSLASGASTADIAHLNASNAATMRNDQAAGMVAGSAVYGSQIAAQRAQYNQGEKVLAELKDLNHHVKKGETIVVSIDGHNIVTAIRREQRKKGQKPSV